MTTKIKAIAGPQNNDGGNPPLMGARKMEELSPGFFQPYSLNGKVAIVLAHEETKDTKTFTTRMVLCAAWGLTDQQAMDWLGVKDYMDAVVDHMTPQVCGPTVTHLIHHYVRKAIQPYIHKQYPALKLKKPTSKTQAARMRKNLVRQLGVKIVLQRITLEEALFSRNLTEAIAGFSRNLREAIAHSKGKSFILPITSHIELAKNPKRLKAIRNKLRASELKLTRKFQTAQGGSKELKFWVEPIVADTSHLTPYAQKND